MIYLTKKKKEIAIAPSVHNTIIQNGSVEIEKLLSLCEIFYDTLWVQYKLNQYSSQL